MKFEKIKYIERKTGEIKIEKVPGEKFLKFLYYNPFGKLSLELLLKRKFLTEYYGRLMFKFKSKNKIKDFVESLDIDMSEAEKNIVDYTSFNDFFYRKLKKDARAIDRNENSFVSPADGKILVFQDLKDIEKFFVKGSEFNLQDFLKNTSLYEKFKDGTMATIRLAPVDYHRLHFPCDCKVGKSKLINGYYYSVSTHAIRTNFNIFLENKREISLLETEKFGDVAFIEVAATMVGGIKQTYKADSYVKKGDEKGYFYFGGSTVVLLFEKDKINFDADIIENTKKKIETKIYMGEKIANAR